MTHIDLNDPKWKTAPLEVWGPAWWSEFHEVMEKVPCGVCRPGAIATGHAVHDVKNAELGKPILYPRDLVSFSHQVNAAVNKCHELGQCSPRTGSSCQARVERCILDVKGSVKNPYAVCQASIQC